MCTRFSELKIIHYFYHILFRVTLVNYVLIHCLTLHKKYLYYDRNEYDEHIHFDPYRRINL